MKNFVYRQMRVMGFFLLTIIVLMPCSKSKAEQRKIIVGFSNSSDMVSSVSISSDTEYKTGYGFDYLQDIASYTGWSYKYVYGEWNELFDLLEQGSIDLLCWCIIQSGKKRDGIVF